MHLHTIVLALSAIIFLMVVLALVRVVNSDTNTIEWADLISTQRDGKQYGDWNKIGQGLGVVLCVWLPLVYAYSDKMDAGGLALVLGTVLAYLGAVSGYSKYLKWKGRDDEYDTMGADKRRDLHRDGGGGELPGGGEGK